MGDKAAAALFVTYLPGGLVYCGRLETLNLDRAKTPGFDDRKRVHIANIDPFTIVESREFSRRSKSKFQADRSIYHYLDFVHFLASRSEGGVR